MTDEHDPAIDPRCPLCGADLYLDWSFSVPVLADVVVHPRGVHRVATSSSWRVECANDHVIAFSQNIETTADCAEAFDPDVFAADLRSALAAYSRAVTEDSSHP